MLYLMVDIDCPGLEPGTNRLKAEYSTIELAVHTEFSNQYNITV